MTRRSFQQNLATLGLIGALGFPYPFSMPAKSRKAPKLKKGDTVGLVAPASPFKPGQLEKSIKNLESLGLKVQLGKALKNKTGYLAGTDQERLDDLHDFFNNKNIKAIWCIRGGYGTQRLLPYLNFNLIKKNPKILIGYSDITALLQAIYLETGLIGFHGPMGASDFTPYERSHLNAILFEAKEKHLISNPEQYEHYHVVRAGQAKGKLIGGNLSLIAALAGTKYEWKVKDHLLFLEDVGESPYRIDRMLTQLRQNCPLEKAAGIILGTFENCDTKNPDRSWTLQQVLEDRLGDLGIPVVYGMCFGHIKEQFTIPVGINARLDTETAGLELLESAVI